MATQFAALSSQQRATASVREHRHRHRSPWSPSACTKPLRRRAASRGASLHARRRLTRRRQLVHLSQSTQLSWRDDAARHASPSLHGLGRQQPFAATEYRARGQTRARAAPYFRDSCDPANCSVSVYQPPLPYNKSLARLVDIQGRRLASAARGARRRRLGSSPGSVRQQTHGEARGTRSRGPRPPLCKTRRQARSPPQVCVRASPVLGAELRRDVDLHESASMHMWTFSVLRTDQTVINPVSTRRP